MNFTGFAGIRVNPHSMMLRTLALASCAALSLLGTAGMPGSLDRLNQTWSSLKDYTVTIVAYETDGKTTDQQTIRYSYAKPDRVKLEILEGRSSGSVVLWHGGDAVTAYHHGLGLFKLHFDLHDGRVTSLRGNTVTGPILGPLVECFQAHASQLTVTPGPVQSDGPTDQLTLTPAAGGAVCPPSSAVDSAITRDVLTISRSTGMIVKRERYAGDMLVERWEMKDFKIDSGLTDSDFR